MIFCNVSLVVFFVFLVFCNMCLVFSCCFICWWLVDCWCCLNLFLYVVVFCLLRLLMIFVVFYGVLNGYFLLVVFLFLVCDIGVMDVELIFIEIDFWFFFDVVVGVLIDIDVFCFLILGVLGVLVEVLGWWWVILDWFCLIFFILWILLGVLGLFFLMNIFRWWLSEDDVKVWW